MSKYFEIQSVNLMKL